VKENIRRYVPLLEYVTFPLVVEGFYDVTPDHQPIVAAVERGLWVAAGFSGHGFMIAPAVARLVADAVTGVPPGEALHVLDLARFAEKRPVPEPQLV
jgi:sarcosine oxidase subunit beta